MSLRKDSNNCFFYREDWEDIQRFQCVRGRTIWSCFSHSRCGEEIQEKDIERQRITRKNDANISENNTTEETRISRSSTKSQLAFKVPLNFPDEEHLKSLLRSWPWNDQSPWYSTHWQALSSTTTSKKIMQGNSRLNTSIPNAAALNSVPDSVVIPISGLA